MSGSLVRGCIALSLAFLGHGCTQLNAVLANAVSLKAPKVAVSNVALAQTPSRKELAAYFCPRVLKERLNVGVAADLLCARSFGPAMTTEQLKFSFDVQLKVDNPNQVPIPLSSALTSVNVFPGAQQSQLGAACVSLCAPDAPQCGAKDQNACPAGATDVTQGADVARALGRMVIAEGARLASGEPLGLKTPEVVANGSLDVVLRIGFDPQQLLPILQRVAGDAAAQLQQGQAVDLNIPYQLAGTLFTGDLGTAGVLSAPFGPIDGAFHPG